MTFKFSEIKSFIDKHQEEIGDEREMTLDRATEERKIGNGEILQGSIAYIFQHDKGIIDKFFKEYGHKPA